MINNNWIEQLSHRLTLPLPGRAAQDKMAHPDRLKVLDEAPVPPPNVRKAAVLVLFHRIDQADHWKTLLIQRTPNQNDPHSGQVSFPGGRIETDDDTIENAALREAWEEVGLSPERVTVLGRLSDMYIPFSNYLVHPVVGVAQGVDSWALQPGEVESILTAPLAYFYQSESRASRTVYVGNGMRINNIPCFVYEDRVVWGATAMILQELTEIFPDGEWI
jgi:8-oxo-dGTP pyrophosphatase MutT (NUDIX family)